MTIKPLLTRPRQQHHLVIRLVTGLQSAHPLTYKVLLKENNRKAGVLEELERYCNTYTSEILKGSSGNQPLVVSHAVALLLHTAAQRETPVLTISTNPTAGS